MRPAEPLITGDSGYYNYEPSKGARDYWLYPLCAGDFTYLPGYHLERAAFDSWLLEVILSGEAEIESEGKSFHARAGDAVLLDCHKPHGYGSATGWRALWVHFDGVSARGYAEWIAARGPVLQSAGVGEAQRCIQEICALLADASPEREAEMALLLTQALTALRPMAEAGKDGGRQALLGGIIARLNRQPGREPSIAEMARQASMSEYHFIRVFTKTTGVTPRQYIIASRMNHAKYLLAHTDETVAAVAAEAGYASESMFCLTFKKTQGITPTEYRLGREKNEQA